MQRVCQSLRVANPRSNNETGSANTLNPGDRWPSEFDTTLRNNATLVETAIVNVPAFTPFRDGHMDHVFDTQGEQERNLLVRLPKDLQAPPQRAKMGAVRF